MQIMRIFNTNNFVKLLNVKNVFTVMALNKLHFWITGLYFRTKVKFNEFVSKFFLSVYN